MSAPFCIERGAYSFCRVSYDYGLRMFCAARKVVPVGHIHIQ